MTRTKILISASAAALGMALIATPASAQEVCTTTLGASGTATGGPPSFACGNGATASGAFAVAVGPATIASGLYATALGNDAQATNRAALAVGQNVQATDQNATALGTHARATDQATTAVGSAAHATAYGATAIGYYAYATGLNSTAVGRGAYANADGAISIGRLSVADGVGSVALGNYADTAGFVNSVALGANTVNTADNQVNVGGRTIAGVADGLIAVGSTEAINGGQLVAVLADDDIYVAINSVGAAASATGADSIAIGGDSVASGDGSIALGEDAVASHTNSVAIGAGTATTADDQVNVGGRTISGVTAGAVNATSTEAINGSQLFASNTALQNDIADLQAEDILLANRIHRVDRRAAGGTAVAIAMGGAMFLPDKTFNLTGNVGLYRSQVAAAVNLGAMVGSSAAFNAGIGSGFNHNGKFGARAGFTFGW